MPETLQWTDDCYKPKSRLFMLAVRIYRANPIRPHCKSGNHVILCRAVAAMGKFPNGSWCPAKDN